MITRRFSYYSLLIVWIFLSCCRNGNKAEYPELNAWVDSVRLQYVPDRRDNVYDISVSRWENKPVVRGVTSVAEAKPELLSRLQAIRPDVIDSIRLLPDENLGDRTCAIANVSVADLRMGPDYAAEMGTQLLLGMPMQVLQNDGSWYRVKTPEGYVSWVQGGTIVRITQQAANEWIASRKVIFTGDYGFAYEQPDENGLRTSDLVFGNLLKWEGESGRFYKVSYPDGRKAYVPKSQSRLFDEWKNAIQLTGESIVRQALLLKGIPYTWGGTSVKALDCSGFTKTVYLKHGVLLRRDASQQAQTGIPVDISEGYEHLLPGDLLFFGQKAEGDRKERVRHVGIYMGNKEFIHEAGFVRVNSLDPAQPHYDKGNTVELIRATRIIGAVGTDGIWALNESPVFQIQK
ncbi:MAG: C40 family peptidase [Dysgonamonadaceae bacterium]|jgi:cell wall-associated NlpC family hydrolase|nr:C40 family peptidase [Dysgonamonadaceae bacterium]